MTEKDFRFLVLYVFLSWILLALLSLAVGYLLVVYQNSDLQPKPLPSHVFFDI